MQNSYQSSDFNRQYSLFNLNGFKPTNFHTRPTSATQIWVNFVRLLLFTLDCLMRTNFGAGTTTGASFCINEISNERCTNASRTPLLYYMGFILTRGYSTSQFLINGKLNPTTKFHCFNHTFNSNNIGRLSHIYIIFLGSV